MKQSVTLSHPMVPKLGGKPKTVSQTPGSALTASPYLKHDPTLASSEAGRNANMHWTLQKNSYSPHALPANQVSLLVNNYFGLENTPRLINKGKSELPEALMGFLGGLEAPCAAFPCPGQAAPSAAVSEQTSPCFKTCTLLLFCWGFPGSFCGCLDSVVSAMPLLLVRMMNDQIKPRRKSIHF